LSGTKVIADANASLISVIVPAHNAARYIARTLASACAQTHREIEIVVVDDGSTDDTASIVENAAAKDGRISLIRSPHAGVSSARNLGIERARGRYLAPLDADDLWRSTKLERQFEILSAAPPETGLVYCWAAGIDEQDDIVLPVWNPSRASGDVLQEIVQSGILSCGSTPLLRREIAERVGGYDPECKLGEDWKFYIALAGECRFEVIPECLTGYRIRSDSASLKVEEMEEALDACTSWIRARWPALPERVFAERQFTLHTYLAFMAIRARKYRRVPVRLLRAVAASPARMFSPLVWELAALMPAHAAGLRRYEWTFWKKRRKFES
jgi:glycosyltransferase involved in cell wall biosynthesis